MNQKGWIKQPHVAPGPKVVLESLYRSGSTEQSHLNGQRGDRYGERELGDQNLRLRSGGKGGEVSFPLECGGFCLGRTCCWDPFGGLARHTHQL